MIFSPGDEKEIEKAKQRVRNLWNYKPVEKIPINVQVYSNPKGYTLQDQIFDVDKQLEVNLNSIKKTLELIPEDYIPVASTDVGNVIIENAFGLKSIFPDNPEQTPIWKKPLIDDIQEVHNLKVPNPWEDNFFQECLNRLRYWVSKLKGKIYTGGFDLGSPINTSMNLLGPELFFINLIDNPALIHALLEKVTQVFILYYSLMIDAAGGINNMASTEAGIWCPEGRKAWQADDVCANLRPSWFKEFSRPYNSRIYRLYGPGIFHNCGPHPCVFEYLDHDPPVRACQFFYEYSKNDIENFAKAFAHKGVVYAAWWGYEEPGKVIKEYKELCEKFAPKTVAILQYTVDESKYTNDEILQIYNELNKISKEYTKTILWR